MKYNFSLTTPRWFQYDTKTGEVFRDGKRVTTIQKDLAQKDVSRILRRYGKSQKYLGEGDYNMQKFHYLEAPLASDDPRNPNS